MPSDSPTSQYLEIGDLLLDVPSRQLWRGETEVELPALSFDLLVALAQNAPGVVSVDELMDEVWGDVVVSAETVTQRVKLLRDALGTEARGAFSSGADYVTTVRGRGYRLAVEAKPTGPRQPSRARLGRARVIGVIAVIVGSLLAVVWWDATRPPDDTPTTTVSTPVDDAPERSIAVLPFVNMTGDPEAEYLGDGMTEELLNRLAQVPGLHIPSRTSSFAFKNRDLAVTEIAGHLGVRNVLEGSVRQSGDRLRITVQFIDVEDDRHIWSRQFDHHLDDVIALQDEVAMAVVEALELGALPVDARSVKPTAFDAYLRGRHKLRVGTATALTDALALLEESIAVDATYAPAHVALAETYLRIARRGNYPMAEADRLAEQAIATALLLDPNLSEAHVAVGLLRMAGGDSDAAETAIRHAITLNEDLATAHLALGDLMLGRQRPAEARQSFQRALELDPLHPRVLQMIAIDQFGEGQYDGAIRALQRRLLAQPDAPETYRLMALFARTYGRLDDAVRWARRAVDIEPDGPLNINELVSAYSSVGRFDDAMDLAEVAYAKAPHNHWVIAMLAFTQINRGDLEDLRAFTDQQLARVPPRGAEPLQQEPRVYLSLAGISASLHEDYQSAASLIQRALGDPLTSVLEPQFSIHMLGTLAHAHLQLGNDERARSAIELATNLIDQQDSWVWRELIYAENRAGLALLQGEEEQAIAILEQAASHGWNGYFGLARSPLWRSLDDHPKFVALKDELERRIQSAQAAIETQPS